MKPAGFLVSQCHLLLFPPGRAMLGLYQLLWSKLETAARKCPSPAPSAVRCPEPALPYGVWTLLPLESSCVDT